MSKLLHFDSISETDLSVRVRNALQRNGILTVTDLLDRIDEKPYTWHVDLRAIGEKSVAEVSNLFGIVPPDRVEKVKGIGSDAIYVLFDCSSYDAVLHSTWTTLQGAKRAANVNSHYSRDEWEQKESSVWVFNTSYANWEIQMSKLFRYVPAYGERHVS